MHPVSRIAACGMAAAFCLSSFVSQAQNSVRSVKVLGSKGSVEIEIEGTDRLTPQPQVLTGPDRLVVDFPNAALGNQVRSQSVDRGEVKDLRVALFQSKPPVTRVVLDLKSAQSYQIFPSGRTVMIKIGSAPNAGNTAAAVEEAPVQPQRPGLVIANYTTRQEPVRVEAAPQPTLQISYRNGLLGVRANKATLAEVLYAIQQRTGADISIAAGAEQEKVVAEIEPAPPAEVLAHLLNGSKFNFLILNSTQDPTRIDRVILSTRPELVFTPSAPQSRVQPREEEPVDDEPAYLHTPPNNPPGPPPISGAPKPDAGDGKADPTKSEPRNPGDDASTPDQ